MRLFRRGTVDVALVSAPRDFLGEHALALDGPHYAAPLADEGEVGEAGAFERVRGDARDDRVVA